MKKLFTSLVLLLGVMVAQAADLTIAGVSVSSTSSSISAGQTKGTISYNASSRTLTFDGVQITKNGHNIIDWKGSNSLTVIFKGTNTLTTDRYPIRSDYDITLNGQKGICATLNLKSTGDNFASATVKGGHTMTFKNLFLTASSPVYGFRGDSDNQSNSKLAFQTVRADISVSSGSIGAISAFGAISFDSYDAFLSSGAFNSSEGAVCQSSSSTSRLNSVSIVSPFTVGNVLVGIGWSNDYQIYPDGLTAGTITVANGGKTLKFSGATFKTSASRAIELSSTASYITDLTVEVIGNNTIERTYAESGSCIHCEKNLIIQGTKYDESFLTLKGNFGLSTYSGGNVTIKDVYVIANCHSRAIVGNNSSSTLTFDKSIALVKGETDGSITRFVSCTYLNGSSVYTGLCPGVCYRAAQKGFATYSAISKETVVVSIPSTYYDLYVLGERVNDLNKSDVQVDGMTAGTISYNESANKLTLTGVQLTAPSGNDEAALELKKAGLTVEFVNNGSTENDITANSYGLSVWQNTTFTGSGCVTFTSKNGSGCNMYGSSTTLTLDMGGRASFFGAKYGMAAYNLVMKKTSDSYHYRFKGGSNASLYVISTFTHDNMDLQSGYSLDDYATYGCYFDNQYVRENGGAVAKGLIAYRYINTKYDLYVGGVQVNDCNAGGIGSKYISGGPKVAVYNASSKKLTLNSGAKITATNDTYGNCIRVSSSFDGNFTLNVAGNSTLTSDFTDKSCFYIESKKAPTTITGSGKLTIGGSASNGIVSYPNLTLDNVEMEMANSLAGSSDTPTLTVKLTTAGRKVTVNGTVYWWSDVLLSSGTKIVNPGDWEPRTTASDKTKWGIYSKSTNALASPVVFGDQTAAGIEGIVADPNAEVIGIFDAQGRKLEEIQPGINILRMSDGTTRKVIKK